MKCSRFALLIASPLLFACLTLPACQTPFDRAHEKALRQRLVQNHRAYLEDLANSPTIEIDREASEVESRLSDKRRRELDEMSGIDAYKGDPLSLGLDLMGEGVPRSVMDERRKLVEQLDSLEQRVRSSEQPATEAQQNERRALESQIAAIDQTIREEQDVVVLSLRRVIELAVQNNLDVQIARLRPAISEARIVEAEAAFDAVYFASIDFNSIDQPQPGNVFDPDPSTFRETITYTSGIRKLMATGGTVTVETSLERERNEDDFANANKFYTATVSATVAQPLLRGFGPDVNLASIELARNARAASVEDLRVTLLEAAAAAEEQYWNLVLARQNLLIQQRLLERTIRDRNVLEKRGPFDVSPPVLTEANSSVEQRNTDVIRAQQQVRLASDRLKRLINTPELTMAGETLIVPLDRPADLPVKFNLLDAVTVAMQNRPEIRQAVLDIDDATIRQRIADNGRLPSLALSTTVQYTGLDVQNSSDAFGEIAETNFIDYIISLQFEVPIGNREPEAVYRRSQLERQGSVIAYQRTVQDVLLQIKEALRDLDTAYRLVGATRAARRAAADNLRALEKQEELGQALTPEFIDLKLRRQESLANSEFQEIQALVDYNTAVARYYQTIGTLLDHNGIKFVEPAP